MIIPSIYPPSDRRWMMFVDGENFTIRGQELAKKANLDLFRCKYFERDVFIWIPGLPAYSHFSAEERSLQLQPQSIRSYYYTSVSGDVPLVDEVREALRAIDFNPSVFKKVNKQTKAKGVDIALTKDVLSHAFLDHYDVAVIVAGDGDYIPLVEEVKRLGKQVCVLFFDESDGLNKSMKLGSDAFVDVTQYFLDKWAWLIANPAERELARRSQRD